MLGFLDRFLTRHMVFGLQGGLPPKAAQESVVLAGPRASVVP